MKLSLIESIYYNFWGMQWTTNNAMQSFYVYVHVLWVSAQFGIEKHRVGFLESPSTADYRFKASKRDEYADYARIVKDGKLCLFLYLYA